MEILKGKKNSYKFNDDTLVIECLSLDSEYIKRYLISVLKEILGIEIEKIYNELYQLLKIDILFKDKIDKLLPFGYTTAKGYYGVCYPKRYLIKFSYILIHFPRKYLYAVLIHELCHLFVLGHDEKFYELMQRFEINGKEIKKEMKILANTYQSDFIY